MRELSLNILDIVMNSIEAEATRVIIVVEELQSKNLLRIRIKDNGRGMDEDFAQKALDPFVTTRTTRTVGMGLPLFRQLAKQSGGDLEIKSQPGVGTLVTATFQIDNLNRPPLGRMADSLVNLIVGALNVHFAYLHRTDDGHFCFDSYWLFGRMAEKESDIYDLVAPAKELLQKELKAIKSIFRSN